MKKPAVLLLAAGVGLCLAGATRPAGGLGLIAIGVALFLAGFGLATWPKTFKEWPARTHAHRWRVDVAVPVNPDLAGTLRTQLEDEVVGLRLELDWEHEEVLVSFLVDASGADLAERIGLRRIERHGLIVEAVRAQRAA